MTVRQFQVHASVLRLHLRWRARLFDSKTWPALAVQGGAHA